jgi:hypothetical protein
MATPTPVRPDENAPKSRAGGQQAAALCRFVIRELGRPSDLFRVSAVRLWDNHFRVNVQTGPDITSVRIAHSFFVSADEEGNVVASVPPIARAY